VTVGEKTGTVFFDDEWDAYGWQTEDWRGPLGLHAGTTNGPFETAEEAEEAIREELEDGR
jgi:hypothetical protein